MDRVSQGLKNINLITSRGGWARGIGVNGRFMDSLAASTSVPAC